MNIKEVKLGDLKTGDQIAVRGNVEDLHPSLRTLTAFVGDTYLHHGIYSKEDCSLYRVEYEDGEYCLPGERNNEEGEEAVEQGSSWPVYNLIMNNCESFATLLKTGKAKSRQVLEALISTLKALVVGVAKSASPGVAGFSGSGNNKH
ncbi:hypothetical protein OS493_019044 [Desmophyllum pertusum]|uniref:Lecithin retinol acyltransferase n=1 Tax=Desmophyllum pertusum TaxID=174260 RepID=A0A9W9Z025_9CNID|nr:hypothetical protein OS493_019044 [Desmophyllum pertusum]